MAIWTTLCSWRCARPAAALRFRRTVRRRHPAPSGESSGPCPQRHYRYRASKFVTRHRAGVTAAAVVLVTLLAAVAITARQAQIARRERARAEQHFNDVRTLANSLIFEIHDSIQNLPGATAPRKLLLDRALQYLDSLATESSGDVPCSGNWRPATCASGPSKGALWTRVWETEDALASTRKRLQFVTPWPKRIQQCKRSTEPCHCPAQFGENVGQCRSARRARARRRRSRNHWAPGAAWQHQSGGASREVDRIRTAFRSSKWVRRSGRGSRFNEEVVRHNPGNPQRAPSGQKGAARGCHRQCESGEHAVGDRIEDRGSAVLPDGPGPFRPWPRIRRTPARGANWRWQLFSCPTR